MMAWDSPSVGIPTFSLSIVLKKMGKRKGLKCAFKTKPEYLLHHNFKVNVYLMPLLRQEKATNTLRTSLVVQMAPESGC